MKKIVQEKWPRFFNKQEYTGENKTKKKKKERKLRLKQLIAKYTVGNLSESQFKDSNCKNREESEGESVCGRTGIK